jgi:hypothetical protein
MPTARCNESGMPIVSRYAEFVMLKSILAWEACTQAFSSAGPGDYC